MQYKGTILQFDTSYHLVGSLSGNLEEIITSVENGDKYYYRFPVFPEIGTRKKIRYSHFGLNGINTSCNQYNAEELLHYSLNYSIQTYYRKLQEKKSYHVGFDSAVFVYAMQLQASDWLKNNDRYGFNERLEAFLLRHPDFIQINDLNEYSGISGIYILVLDKYNVCYIGQAQSSLKTRIKQHWARSNYFQRGIDRFKSFDTTRIYVWPIESAEMINEAEYRLVPDFPEQYTLNFGSFGGDIAYMNNHRLLDNVEPIKRKDDFLEYMELAEKILGVRKE